jgi:DNA-binding HxlR family transcriptional regulator
MSDCKEKHLTCPLEKTLSVVGDKWTFLIIRDLLKGTKRFGELSKSLDGISPRTLTQRLRELETNCIIKRKIHPEVPPRVEYKLTKRGEALAGILKQMEEWSECHMEDKEEHHAKV